MTLTDAQYITAKNKLKEKSMKSTLLENKILLDIIIKIVEDCRETFTLNRLYKNSYTQNRKERGCLKSRQPLHFTIRSKTL